MGPMEKQTQIANVVTQSRTTLSISHQPANEDHPKRTLVGTTVRLLAVLAITRVLILILMWIHGHATICLYCRRTAQTP